MFNNNKKPSSAKLIISTSAVFFALSCLASEPKNYLTEDDLLADIPQVSGVSNFRQRLQDAPSSVTIIDRDMIRASGALELVEVFRLVPGMFSYYVNGGRHSVAHHGFADVYSPRLEIKVDGRSAYNPIYSSVEWTGLGVELQDIDYIEVIRGPNSPADGANAFQGTINIVTRSSVAEKGSSLRLEAGDIETRNASYVDSGTLGEIDYRATLRYRSNNGFSEEIPAFSGFYVHPNPIKNGKLTNKLSLGDLDPNDPGLDHIDDTETTIFGLRTSYAPDLHNRFDIDTGFSDGEIGIGGDGEAEGDTFFRRNYEQNYQSLIWTHTIDESSDYKTTFYRNYFNFESGENVMLSEFIDTIDTANDLGITPQTLLAQLQLNDGLLKTREEGYSERYDLDSRWAKKFTSTQFSIGGQYRVDMIDSDVLLSQQEPIDEEFARIYSNIEWSILPDTIFNAGISKDHDSTIGTHSSNRFSLNQHIGEHHTLRVSSSHATRGPTNLEANRKNFIYAQGNSTTPITAAYQPDPNQREEELTVNDIAWLGQFLQNRLTTSIRLYREDYENIFDEIKQLDGTPPTLFDPENTARNYANSANLNIEGAEFELKYKTANDILVSLQYMNQNTDGLRVRRIYPTDLERNVIDQATPRETAGILLGYLPDNNWQYSANWYFQSQVGCQEILLDQPKELDNCWAGSDIGNYDKGWIRGNFQDDFSRLDLRIARPFKFSDSSGTIAFIGHNVLDETYNEFHNFNIFEPRYYVQLTLDF